MSSYTRIKMTLDAVGEDAEGVFALVNVKRTSKKRGGSWSGRAGPMKIRPGESLEYEAKSGEPTIREVSDD